MADKDDGADLVGKTFVMEEGHMWRVYSLSEHPGWVECFVPDVKYSERLLPVEFVRSMQFVAPSAVPKCRYSESEESDGLTEIEREQKQLDSEAVLQIHDEDDGRIIPVEVDPDDGTVYTDGCCRGGLPPVRFEKIT